jgi:purine nucleosidase
MHKKILLDTDIGTDIDDAVCLAYLLANPDCELMGITTVTGEAEKRAMIASAICRHAGKDIPIFPGSDKPILIPQHQLIAQQAEALNKWEFQKKFPKGEAVDFMRRIIRENPGEISLVTIGPLTNIALLFAIDPEVPSLLKELVIFL